MPKCLECGFESSRLQWTHFKYKCTGRFNNGTEYKKIYPNAKLVDDELAKKTSLTINTFIKKYGETVGKEKWEQYKNKQAYSNTFEYKKEKYGWTKEYFDEYNKKRAVTLENLIDRYGEFEGVNKWKEYCDRQSYTKTLKYFIDTYGKEIGIKKYKEVNSKKAQSLENICKRHNCTKEEAYIIIQERFNSNNNSGVSNIEKIFVEELEKILNFQLHYTFKTKQFCLYGNEKANFYDIVHGKKAIEFNGDFWHCNPKLFVENYFHKIINKTAKEIWETDIKKIQLLKEKTNIECMVVWENDFLNDPENILKECKEWILSEKK